MLIVTCGGTHPILRYDLLLISSRPFFVYVIIADCFDASPQALRTIVLVFPDPAEATMIRLFNCILNIAWNIDRLVSIENL